MGHALPEPFDTASTHFRRLLARVDGVAHAAGFHALLLDRTWDQKHRLARGAGGFGVFEDLGVNGCFHSWEILHIFGA